MTDVRDYNVAAQLERTVLAWNRSSLAIAANGALVARAGFTREVAAVAAAGCAVVVVGAVLWMLSIGVYPAAVQRKATNLFGSRAPVALAVAIFVLLLSAANMALVLTS